VIDRAFGGGRRRRVRPEQRVATNRDQRRRMHSDHADASDMPDGEGLDGLTSAVRPRC
jgi:hypothetical protein